MKQMEHDFMKKSDSLEGKMKSLAEFKAEKLAEQKDFQSKEKLLKKQIKTFEEEKAKLSVTRKKLERDFNHNKVDKESVSIQTEHHIDIPYHISSPLPPIFSSNLCHRTPPIKFLSSSLPNLNTILWVLPDTSYVDEAEEFLSYQHDNMVKLVYRLRKEQAQARKYERILEKYDLALTSSKQVADILSDDSYDESWINTLHIDSLSN